MGVGAVVAVEAGEDPFGGEASEGVGVLCDDGQAGVEEFGELEVVEADVGDGCARAEFGEGAQRSEREQVLCAEDRGWRFRGEEELTSRRVCVGGVGEVGPDELGVLGDVVLVECLVVSAAALERGVDGLAAAEEGDPAVPRGDQV